jgi:hypothetical protein
MAFPGTLNINYYKGDTHEFRIYPKNANGGEFDLGTTLTPIYTNPTFKIATERGSAGVATQVTGFADINYTENYIRCVITPGDGNLLDATKEYVYDVQIRKAAGQPDNPSWDVIHTLLTGTITVTDQVTHGIGNA